MDNCRTIETRTNSLSSEFAAHDGRSNEFTPPETEETSGHKMGSFDVTESEWTNEKHSLYLKSMEASFVDHLYNSKHLLAHPRALHKQKLSHSNLHSGQFKALRGGCWEEVNFERVKKLSKRKNSEEFHALLGDPWISHFRPSDQCKHDHHHKLPPHETPITRTNSTQPNHLHRPKKTATRSRSRSHSHLFAQQHILSTNAEVSDQNFVNEDSEGEEESSARNAKGVRSTTLIVTRDDASTSDQVVPFS